MIKTVKRTINGKIQEYEYKKDKVYDEILHIRIDKELKENILKRTKELGYKKYTKYVRELIENDIQR